MKGRTVPVRRAALKKAIAERDPNNALDLTIDNEALKLHVAAMELELKQVREALWLQNERVRALELTLSNQRELVRAAATFAAAMIEKLDAALVVTVQ